METTNQPMRRIITKEGNVDYLNKDQSGPTREERRAIMFPKKTLRAQTAAMVNNRGVYVAHWQLAAPTGKHPSYRMIPHIQFLHYNERKN